MKFNLIAGLLWLGFGILLLVLQRNDPDNPAYYLGVGISGAWLAFIFALYNFSRVYAYRSAARTRALLEQDRENQAHRTWERKAPDPAFDLPEIPPADGPQPPPKP